uniref:MX dynamin like GTPase 2 n=1 Tax=Ursus americanus TaxID=9643 RepID=A0A452SQW2_URSAM
QDAVNEIICQYEEKVRPCLDLIDSLRALGVEQDLALPAIAVIGDQSSGKSSVLEALSGVALPRGSGIVTRCPLVLKLKRQRHECAWRGRLSYRKTDLPLQDPSQVEKEILKAQNTIAGNGLSISHELISLEITSPEVPDLTLIDLPGITRVPVGNQPQDIGLQIKALIKKYIQRQQTINLVVVPCNVDIATTEALSMAQEVDPEGDRTIEIVWETFANTAKKHFSEFSNLNQTAQNKIEGIKTKQAETAENLIRLQFRMEQLVYCQDEIYREVLNQVRKEFFNPVGTSLKDPELKLSFSKDQSSMSSITEIGTHLNAYFWRLANQIPFIIQYFVLQENGSCLQKAMMQILQDREHYSWLLQEQSDTSTKRRFLKEKIYRLTQARHALYNFCN